MHSRAMDRDFKETLSNQHDQLILRIIFACAVPFMCTDIPTPAKNEYDQGCNDLNTDEHFKSGMNAVCPGLSLLRLQ